MSRFHELPRKKFFFTLKKISPVLPLRLVFPIDACGPLRGIAPKPRPLTAKGCSIDVTDFADIFTVDRPSILRTKSKISAQMDEPFQRYACDKYRGVKSTQNICKSVFYSKFSFSQQWQELEQRFFYHMYYRWRAIFWWY